MADFLIVVITAYLSYRFKNFYRIFVQTIKNRAGRQIPWFEIQAHYTRLTKLVALVDDLISPLIFTVFLSHLLLNCKQIYDVIQKQRTAHLFQTTECVLIHSGDAITVFYLSFSLAVLLLRSLMVSLMTAHLHTISREPLNALHTVSSSAYNNDMQKFMDQVYNSKVCLTGLKFFYVTRGTVLSMISTILTYELVLLQIND
ncbi:gustatory receptor for sugar taste 61a-like [Epargyreus clarus]|uniref:gustatory receptor for sugar taste 61a-like n=1 Tax=Epargyreus clarus TaxID=520877 RepID=UPI003C2CB1E4